MLPADIFFFQKRHACDQGKWTQHFLRNPLRMLFSAFAVGYRFFITEDPGCSSGVVYVLEVFKVPYVELEG